MSIIKIIIGGILFLVIGCKNKRVSDEEKVANIEGSSYFKELLRIQNHDSTATYRAIRNNLSEIGETSFLMGRNYEYYIVAYTKFSMFGNRVFKISKDKLGTHISFKTGNSDKVSKINNLRETSKLESVFEAKEISATLESDSSFNLLKTELDNLVNKIELIDYGNTNSAIAEILYFNGKDHFYFSFLTLSSENYSKVLEIIHSIKNTSPFLGLRSIDANYAPDAMDTVFDERLKK